MRIVKLINEKIQTDRLIVFDVGANEGDYSLSLIANLSTSRPLCIHAFEPVKKTFEIYVNKLSPASPLVKCNNFGLGDKEEKVQIYKFAETTGISSMYGNNLFSSSSTESISLKTLDGYCETCQISEIDFLKIDVEGHDYHVLLGAKKMIDSESIKVIQFEFGSININSRTYFRDFYNLLSQKYNLYRIVPHGILPVKVYSYKLEVFGVVTNYLAILKSVDWNTRVN